MKKAYTVNLDDKIVEEIRKTPGINLSRLIRYLLQKYLEEQKNG